MTKVYDTATDLITFARLQSQNTTSGSSYLGSDGLLKFAAEDEPRIEYAADGSLKGLLIEEQRTNLVTHSEDFTQWSALTQGTGSTPALTAGYASPDGGNNAYRLQLNAGGNTSNDYSLLRTTFTSPGNLSRSIWIKSNTGSDQTVALVATNPATKVTATTEWQRLSDSVVTSGTGQMDISLGGAALTPDTADILIYGAQAEAGSFATSYIPTSGSQQTRSADVASIPVSAFGYNQTAGTVVVEFSKMYPDAAYNRFHAGFGANSGNYVGVGYSSAQRTYVQPLVGAISVSGASAPSPGGFATVAAGFDASGATAAVDGQSNSATAIGAAPAFSSSDTLYLGSSAYYASEIASGHIKSLSYFPRRLTDVQLQELTS